jgi:hypothetical protein
LSSKGVTELIGEQAHNKNATDGAKAEISIFFITINPVAYQGF